MEDGSFLNWFLFGLLGSGVGIVIVAGVLALVATGFHYVTQPWREK